MVFSAKFTASHVDDFRIEVASLTPHVPDTIPPVCIDYRWLGNHALELQFNEPLSSSTGFGIWNDGDSLFFIAESHMSNKRIGIFSGNWPIGQARELSLLGIQDVQGIEGTQTQIEVLRTSSQGIKPHEVQFTEIMFDPSPSLGLPEEEWLEIINRSELHHSIEDFILLDGSSETQSNLTPQFGWDGILAPGERAIVTGSDVCIAGDSIRQAEGIPWPGLNNAGESLMLLGEDGSIADQVHYRLGLDGGVDRWGSLLANHPLGRVQRPKQLGAIGSSNGKHSGHFFARGKCPNRRNPSPGIGGNHSNRGSARIAHVQSTTRPASSVQSSRNQWRSLVLNARRPQNAGLAY